MGRRGLLGMTILDSSPEISRRPRLLLFEQRLIGDAIMSLPFVRSAEAEFEVYVACAEVSASIFKMVLPEERVLAWTPPWFIEGGGLSKWRKAATLAYLRRLRAVRAHVAASGWADARGHLLMALCGAKVRAGFPMNPLNFYASHLPWRRKQIRIGRLLSAAGTILAMRPLLTKNVSRSGYEQHHVEDFHDLARALGIAWDEHRPWLPRRGAPAGPGAGKDRPLWLVHPGARAESRRWPLASFIKIVREVLVPGGARVIFLQPPEIRDALPPLPAGVEVVAPAGLRELLDICGTADLLLCNDTGVSHMGAALGTPTVSIFSSANPNWFAPRGCEKYLVARDVCPHRPCLDHCVMPSYICMEAVTYEMVREKVLMALEDWRAGG